MTIEKENIISEADAAMEIRHSPSVLAKMRADGVIEPFAYRKNQYCIYDRVQLFTELSVKGRSADLRARASQALTRLQNQFA